MKFPMGSHVCRKEGTHQTERAVVLNSLVTFLVKRKKGTHVVGGFTKIRFDTGGEYIYPTEDLERWPL